MCMITARLIICLELLLHGSCLSNGTLIGSRAARDSRIVLSDFLSGPTTDIWAPQKHTLFRSSPVISVKRWNIKRLTWKRVRFFSFRYTFFIPLPIDSLSVLLHAPLWEMQYMQEEKSCPHSGIGSHLTRFRPICVNVSKYSFSTKKVWRHNF